MRSEAIYEAYQLSIRSDIPLPELSTASNPANVDLRIIKDDLPGPPTFPDGATRYIQSNATESYFAWKDLGVFLARNGEEIICDPLPEVSQREFRLPLLGPVLGVLLHQRSVPTFHASAVSIGGKAVAFMGWKGSGKSTLAATLLGRGHPLLTDDMVALRFASDEPEDNDTKHDSEGRPFVIPAFPQVKLWPNSAVALGLDKRHLASLSDKTSKGALRDRISIKADDTPLHRIYLLEEGDELKADRLTGGDAFAALMAQSYAPRFLGSAASTHEYFKLCQAVVRQVPIYRLNRPLDLTGLHRIAAFIESECRASTTTELS